MKTIFHPKAPEKCNTIHNPGEYNKKNTLTALEQNPLNASGCKKMFLKNYNN